MSIRLHSTSSKNSVCYYIKEDYVNPKTNKRTTRNRQSLGNLAALMKQFGVSTREEVEAILRDQIEQLKADDNQLIPMTFNPHELIPMGVINSFNVGYLFPQKILSMLGCSASNSISRKRQIFLYTSGRETHFILSGLALFWLQKHFILFLSVQKSRLVKNGF